MSKEKLPVYEIEIQVASEYKFVSVRVLTLHNPNGILMDWDKEYKPVGYIERN